MSPMKLAGPAKRTVSVVPFGPMRCSITAGFQGSSRLTQAFAAYAAGSSPLPGVAQEHPAHPRFLVKATMLAARIRWLSSPVKNSDDRPASASTSRTAHSAAD
jgi:hypothetical protein